MLRPHFVCLFVLALALGAGMSAHAQGALDDTTAWEPLGDARQQLQAFTFSGDRDAPTIWGGDSGVYRLDQIDGAWEQVYLFPQGGPMLFLGDPFDESGPDTLFVGGSLYRSVDGGQTFDGVLEPPNPDGSRRSRIGSRGALDQFPPDSPYPGRLVSGHSPATVYSDDGGDTWTRTVTSPRLQTFRLHTFRSGRVVAAGFYGAVLSRDGGQTYAPIPALYDTTRIGFDLTEMLMLDGFVTGRPGDSTEGRLLIIGTQAGRPSTYAWTSDDEGETWREVHAFEYGGTWTALTAVPTEVGGGPGWAAAADPYPGRVWATTDGGETWTQIGRVPGVMVHSDGHTTYAETVETGPDGRLYAGTVRSGNKASWSYRSRGRVAEAMQPVARDPEPEAPASVGVSVWPNPTGGAVTVRLSLASPQAVRVSVVDALGREVAVLHEGAATDGQRVALDAEGWPVGAYSVRVVTEAGTASAGLTVAW
ncbi:hypothetical protein B1759_18105 [Rubrivirga sp. SAORIC476]|uniref:T9SS type A sorting domain-containing protein n=1 Tax=Rubrivirga sp. SAORIC476 TaxID=1961794 RepID=UPI000BA8D869|nr:T9SS type A sorting domain-containing protein [Rubrivirga sp. SAORIC476]PAP74341.1 hypothetical protein B1759_18105 [Rubrivirga sp. SAORIC476]